MSKHQDNNIAQVFVEVKPDETIVAGMLDSSKVETSGCVEPDGHKNCISDLADNQKISDELKEKPKSRTAWNKGKSSWCKGLSAATDTRIASRNAKISASSKGKPGTNLGKHFSEEHKKKLSDAHKGRSPKPLSAEQLKIKTTKQYLTRKKNSTFNTSRPEDEFYDFLLKTLQNKTIYRNYKDPQRYPFYCDFYIVEDDLFIEVNAHWTHGGRPYDPNDLECQKQLAEWQEKAKTSKFYENAITTWTIRDVLKLQTAIKNNLNYKTIY